MYNDKLFKRKTTYSNSELLKYKFHKHIKFVKVWLKLLTMGFVNP